MVKKENLVAVFILKMITKKRKRGGAFPRGHGYFEPTTFLYCIYFVLNYIQGYTNLTFLD